MKRYSCKRCGCAAVEAMLQLADIDYQFIDAIQWSPHQRRADLETLNPLGQVPVLVQDDGRALIKSGPRAPR